MLALAALAAQRTVIYLPEADLGMAQLRALVIAASYGALLAFAAANLRLAPMRVLALGLFLNALVILANGGAMPVTKEALMTARPHPEIELLNYGDPVPGTKEVLLPKGETALWPLSDVLVLPGPDPVGTTFSIGDVLIAAGAFWLVLVATQAKSGRPHKQPVTGQDGLQTKVDNR